ncbi:hypothetical protein [Mucilaginibacter gracilis]|uniref:hypothetical protein n=1 Tax=Mucilaginibacter gracilis TaxID=423350 RepID=UPI0013C337B6|nr:hypothetical protein [Mucilaginibacter gracilis]
MAPKVPPVLSVGLPPVLLNTRLRVPGFQHTACGIANLPVVLLDASTFGAASGGAILA